jgi:hypothetical protein
MQLEWWEHKEFYWMLTGPDNYVLAMLKHYPIGWELHWRPSTKHKWADRMWTCAELEEAKAWAIAMIRMSQ